jgi:hypothetical protein
VVTLRRFPQRTVRGDRQIYRIHRADTSGWWFSADGSGRFDPVDGGKGACYFAEEPLGAWIEVFRRQMLLRDVAIADRALLSAALGREVRLADLTSRRALQFGVTASLGADPDYNSSQAFAVDAVKAGFAGIRYFVRHDPSQKLYGIALFGEPGSSAEPTASRTSSSPIPDELVDQARARFGCRIVPRP